MALFAQNVELGCNPVGLPMSAAIALEAMRVAVQVVMLTAPRFARQAQLTPFTPGKPA